MAKDRIAEIDAKIAELEAERLEALQAQANDLIDVWKDATARLVEAGVLKEGAVITIGEHRTYPRKRKG